MRKIKNWQLYASLIIICVFSIFYFITMNKYSYAFAYDKEKEQKVNQLMLINKCAEIYAENNSKLFSDKDTIYITVNDLVTGGILPSEDGKVYEAGSNVKLLNDNKIRITLADDKYTIKLLNE